MMIEMNKKEILEELKEIQKILAMKPEDFVKDQDIYIPYEGYYPFILGYVRAKIEVILKEGETNERKI